jgi:hypothetical protein
MDSAVGIDEEARRQRHKKANIAAVVSVANLALSILGALSPLVIPWEIPIIHSLIGVYVIFGAPILTIICLGVACNEIGAVGAILAVPLLIIPINFIVLASNQMAASSLYN